MEIGGAMKVCTFAAIAVLAALAAGCGGRESGAEGRAGQGDVAISAPGDAARAVAFQTGGPNGGVLPGITVTGTGTASAVPDVADWSFGVQSDADAAAAAMSSAAEATQKIIDALRGAGIEQRDLRTEHVSLYPRTTDDGRAVIGYTASSSVHATVRKLDKAGAIVDAAVRAGANEIYGPTLRVDDTRAQYQAAAEAALDDARSRAEALAAKAGLTLGAPVAIVDGGGGSPMPAYDRALAGAESAVPIEPGVNEITAALTVTFAIS
jgi:uncharacterized protein YggE